MKTLRLAWPILLLLALGALPAQGASPPGSLTAHFINVGQGDSIWVRLPSGEDLLIDGGKPAAGPTVVAYLRGQGVSDIDLLVATHGDSDHIGGLLDVLEALPVGAAWLDSQDCDTQTCTAFYEALAAHGVNTSLVRRGEAQAWGAVTALVLNPSDPLYADKNNNSVVVRLSYGTVDVLLTGDAETGAEGRMRASGLPLEAEILKAGHHGSNSSSSAAFLQAVSPREAIISVGPNSYGHPNPTAMQRMASAGANIWRTDELGTIIVNTDGLTWTVRGELTPEATATPTRTPTASPTATPSLTPSPTSTTMPLRLHILLPVVMRE